jgi:hypothetical protein
VGARAGLVHVGLAGAALVGALLHDLVHLVLVLDCNLLQSLDDDTSLVAHVFKEAELGVVVLVDGMCRINRMSLDVEWAL